MTLRKKLLLVSGALAVFVLVTLLVLPVLVKGPVTSRARAQLDRGVAAHVDWGGMGLTFFRDFPNLTLSVRDLTVVGQDRFQGDTLASVGSLRLVLDALSVFRAWRGRGPIVVRSIRLDEPVLRLVVMEDGTPSWDLLAKAPGGSAGGEAAVTEPASTPATSKSLNVELRGFEVSDGDVAFANRHSGLDASLTGLRFALDGDLTAGRVTVKTAAHADRTTVRFAGIPYLDGVALDFSADVDADLAAKHFVFKDNELRLNDLALSFSGEATQQADGVAMDVRFSAPRTDFGQAVSLVPVIYARDFASLQTAGTFTVEGSVNGTFGQGSLPAFNLKAVVANGMFRYPDLPLPARDIAFDMSVDKPAGDVDGTVVRLDRFHVVIGDQPLDASLTLRTPVSDPDVDANVRGTLDLGAAARTVKLEQMQELSGVVTADASVRARLSDVDNARYDRVDARGSIAAKNLVMRSPELRQPVDVQEATLDLTPRRADLKSFQARIGSSDLRAHGWIDNLLGFVLRREPLQGSATFASSHFVLDEWKSKDPELEVIPVPAFLDLTLDGTIDSLTYGQLQMTDARGKVTVKDQKLTMDDFALKTLGGRMAFNGTYDTNDPARPTFDLVLNMDSVDVARASAALLTVRTFAPVARYARGTFSTQLNLNGVLNHDMTPAFDALNGNGLLHTSRLSIDSFPLLQKLASSLSMPRLSNPTLEALRSSIELRDGRLHVRPFRVAVGDFAMSVEGSNGIDQSLSYTLGLALPRAAMGSATEQFVQGLAAKAGKAGLDLKAADSVRLGVTVGGTVKAPTLEVGLGEAAASAGAQVKEAATAAVEQRLDEGRAKVDSAEAEARRRAQAQADSIVAAAEQQADQVRAEARKLADQIRAEADRQANEVLAKATNPAARLAAKPVADRIRSEANKKADTLVQEADQRADAMVAEARKKADALTGGGAGGG